MKQIILASSSPRRIILLEGLLKNFGLKFINKPANIKEYTNITGSNYSSAVKKLAFDKANAISKRFSGVIIGADTIVVLDGKILVKPKSKKEAAKMLRMLSDNWHSVYTGICIIDNLSRSSYLDYEVTKVKFRKLDHKEIKYYVKCGSPLDKAGAYGIQDDFGSTFVQKINGDFFNVVGLPLMKTYLGLKKILKLGY